MKKFDIIGLGEACVDCFLLVANNSDPTHQQEILDWSIQGGGKVSTAIVAASKLGAKTSILTKIGNDEAGDFVISDFRKYNVNLGPIVREAGCRTEICFILVDKQTGIPKWVNSDFLKTWSLPEDIEHMRTLVNGQSTQFASEKFNATDIEYITQGEILHIDGFFPDCLSAVEIAKKNQIITSYDLDVPLFQYIPQPCLDTDGRSINLSRFSRFLANIDFLISSKNAAIELTNQFDSIAMCKKLLSYGPKAAAITLGNRGSILMTNQKTLIKQKAFPVPIVDTTGAGDVFHGAFCFGLLNKWNFKENLRFSSAVSALKCMKMGGRAGIPTLNETCDLLKAN